MKRARQHGKPAPPAGEELKREIMDAELELTPPGLRGPRGLRGGAGEAVTTGLRAQERRTEESDW
ncbi:hypothetical protein [Streptomyces sp. NPDC002133]|uniref:hypothetical protein n=1 Tax=Streptomyces sp. NPDC002133 TaxID=3154409 RepID=UPI0033187FC9